MPFLPYSIRGEDYDFDKDESLNMMIKEYTNNTGEVKKISPDNNIDMSIEENSNADIPATYEDVVRHNVFKCSMSLDVIMEGIENQFDNYISNDDSNNYVDIFYDALHDSFKAATEDNELHQEDVINVLNEIQDKFIDTITGLFNTRLTLTIADIESESYDQDEVEFIIRKLYEFFILGAKNNFKVAIANDAKKRINGIINNHREYIMMLRNMMIDYSPLITTFGPMEFLTYIGDQEIIDLFDDGKVIGNFLRKYSPKLYQNEEFEVELITYITMVHQFNQTIQEEYNNG